MKACLLYLFFLSLFFPAGLTASGQAGKTDSLLKTATAIYNAMPDSSMYYCREAEAISKKEHLEEQYAYSLLCEARYLLLKGDLKPTLEKINEAANIFKNKNNNSGLAKSYSLKSILMGRLKNEKERLEFLLKSKDLYTIAKDTDGLINVSVNLSNAYSENNDYSKAIYILNELKKLNLAPGKTDFFIELNYGVAYFKKGDYAEAIIHFQNSVQLARVYKMIDSEITGLTMLAENFHRLKKTPEAIKYFNKALDLARKNNLLVEEADALESLIKLLEENKNYPEAFNALKRFRLLKDSLLNIEKLKSINEIENKLKISEKEKIIAEQGLSLEKENAELASSKFRGIILTGGIIVLVAALVFLFLYLNRTRKLYALIQVQKKEVEFQKELVEAKNKEVTDSINYARYIQYGMLPSEKTIKNLFPEHFIFYKPKDIVAGDFYWVEKTADGKPLLAVCDCTGHGVPGAMVSIVACNALTRAVKEFKLTSPSQIFDKVNVLMQEAFSTNDYEIKDGMDGVLCTFNSNTMQLQIAAANNPVWIVGPSLAGMISENQMDLSHVIPDKQPIGRHGEEIRPFELKTVSLNKGEMIYLFSDGYADQFGGPKGKKFKYKQLEELLRSIAHLPVNEQKSILNKRFTDWQGMLDQVDDVLVVGVRV
jgi:serine phosphatase RsbU (regulator of sigma subunit)